MVHTTVKVNGNSLNLRHCMELPCTPLEDVLAIDYSLGRVRKKQYCYIILSCSEFELTCSELKSKGHPA